MYKTPSESLAFLELFLPLVEGTTGTDVALFPSITSLSPVLERLRGSKVAAGAQAMHWLDEGAYTGQTSPAMLKEIGCTHVLIGHSERRTYAYETDEMVNLQLKAAIANDLAPVVCVGETLDKRQSNLTDAVLRWQVTCALNGIGSKSAGKLVIAYEPVWAIGTGVTASPEQAQEAHATIRREVSQCLGKEFADSVRILYGGSVKPENAGALMGQPDIDGALVGVASLLPATFARIVNY